MPIKYDELMALKNLGQKYAYTDREVIRHQTVLKDEKGEKFATLVASRFARGDGGFGGPSEGQPEPHEVPTRAPDRTIDIATRPDQALVYRLCGDRNPLHSDPEFAK